MIGVKTADAATPAETDRADAYTSALNDGESEAIAALRRVVNANGIKDADTVAAATALLDHARWLASVTLMTNRGLAQG